MARTSRPDQNWYSVSNNVAELYSGTDHPTPSDLDYLSQSGALLPSVPQDWDAVLKLCDYTSSLLRTGLQIAQGRENTADLNNRAHDIALLDCDFGVGGGEGDQVLTIKGGCYNVKCTGTIHSSGHNADVVLGQWSDQCFDAPHDLDFSGLHRADGKTLTFIVIRVRNVVLPPGAKVLFWKSLGARIYWWAKWVAVKVGLLK